MRKVLALLVLLGAGLLGQRACAEAQPTAPKVYVVLWFDTEDYVLSASDDAAMRVADWLTKEGIKATFKVVGEKARTLEKRGRKDVIEALKKHEIGYHSNYHSTQPSPAMYLSLLGWDEGVAEFDRRERPGVHDLVRIFGQVPSCYGQPGSSWGPQVYGAMRNWRMPVYLDAGSHVRLDDKPHYYCGILTLYRLEHTIRTKLQGEADLKETEDKFLAARKKLLLEGGGIVSTYYHPCEFVHKEFWDGVNFKYGLNPPLDQLKLPPQKTPAETEAAYENFTTFIRFMKRFPDVQFITATEAADLYADTAMRRNVSKETLLALAKGVRDEVTFQRIDDVAFSAAETFLLLNDVLADERERKLSVSPLGPTTATPAMPEPVLTTLNQFLRTARDVQSYVEKHERIPGVIWLGSSPVTPEAYLVQLADLAARKLENKELPSELTIRPARLAAADYVSADDPKLWGWVIFPRNFRAPLMMDLAKRQAWTLKPALLRPEALQKVAEK